MLFLLEEYTGSSNLTLFFVHILIKKVQCLLMKKAMKEISSVIRVFWPLFTCANAFFQHNNKDFALILNSAQLRIFQMLP